MSQTQLFVFCFVLFCFFILVTDSEFLLDFLVRQTTSYVETVTLPSLREFTLSFWMKRGFDGSLKVAIMSYTTIQELKSLLLVVGSKGALNVHIMDSRFVTPCYIYVKILNLNRINLYSAQL